MISSFDVAGPFSVPPNNCFVSFINLLIDHKIMSTNYRDANNRLFEIYFSTHFHQSAKAFTSIALANNKAVSGSHNSVSIQYLQ